MQTMQEEVKELLYFDIFSLFGVLEVEPSSALAAISQVFDLDWSALEKFDWFPYDYVTMITFSISGFAAMTRQLPEDSGRTLNSGDIVVIYANGLLIVVWFWLSRTLRWNNTVSPWRTILRLRRSRCRDSLLALASLARSAVDVLDVGEAGNFVCVFLNVDVDWDLGGFVDVNEIEKIAVKCRFNHLQDSRRAKRGRVPELI